MEAQAARIRALATAEGLDLIGIVEDSGKSALDMSREGLNEVLAAAPHIEDRGTHRARIHLGPHKADRLVELFAAQRRRQAAQ